MFHRPSWSSSACTAVVLLPRPLFSPLEIPAWKTSRLSFPRTDLPQALRGFCFASVSTETQSRHMGKELFFFLTPFFYFSPSLISLHKKKNILYFFSLPTVCGCILADQLLLWLFTHWMHFFPWGLLNGWKYLFCPRTLPKRKHFHFSGWRMKFFFGRTFTLGTNHQSGLPQTTWKMP